MADTEREPDWLVLWEYGTDFVITHRLRLPGHMTLDEAKERAHQRIDQASGKTRWRVTYTKLIAHEEYRNN